MQYLHRKIQKGREDKFRYKMERTHVSAIGIITSEPIDITGWSFKLYVHRGVELDVTNYLFSVEGIINDGRTGNVIFDIPADFTNIPSATYWYTITYIRADGVSGCQESMKYIIADSLNTYFDIYTYAPYVEKSTVNSESDTAIAIAELKQKVAELEAVNDEQTQKLIELEETGEERAVETVYYE